MVKINAYNPRGRALNAKVLGSKYLGTRSSSSRQNSAKKKTSTRTIVKMPNRKPKSLGYDGPMSSSYGRYPYKKELTLSKTQKAATGMQTVVCDKVSRLEWNQGTQGVINGASLFTYDDIVSFNDLFAAIVTPNLNLNQKYFVQDVKSAMMITNQSTDIAKITLYDCIARYGGISSNYYTPEAAWNTGLTYANGQQTQDNRPGGKPFVVPGFTENWYVAKSTEIVLATGGHHIHYLNPKVNQVISKDLTQKSASQYATFPKLTAYTMVVAHGFPVNDGTTKTNISTAQGALDIVHIKEYHIRILSESPSSLKLQTTNFVLGSGAIVNDASGTVSTVQTT